jgi:hypothetical protein
MNPWMRFTAGIVTLFVAVAVGCSAPSITDATPGELTLRQPNLGAPNLIECPTNGASSSTATVGPLGGIVSVGGTSVSVPVGALLSPVSITVTVPESNLMEIDVSVSGTEHFVFEQPIVVTLSYARCNRGDIDATPLSVWFIDSETKAPIESMGGVDNKLLRTVTFVTPHLSGYAIAN